MDKIYVRDFDSFKESKQIKESVIERGSEYLVNIPFKVTQSQVNALVKKTKDETGKDLRKIYSESQLAEELIKWVVDNHLDIDSIPVSALLGGEEEMAVNATDDVETVDTTDIGDDIETTDTEVQTEDEQEIQTEDEPIEDEFESPDLDETETETETEEVVSDDVETEDSEEDEVSDEVDELPI